MAMTNWSGPINVEAGYITPVTYITAADVVAGHVNIPAGGNVVILSPADGGPAARLAKDCIKKVEVLDYEELGMEAVWKIEVEDFPAFIVVDDKGNDFFAATSIPLSIGKAPN